MKGWKLKAALAAALIAVLLVLARVLPLEDYLRRFVE